MIGVKSDLNEKKIEANILSELISEISKQKKSVQKASILKSAYILLLYNIIESTTTNILERIHEAASTEKYINLSSQLRVLWVDYYFNKHPEKNRQLNLENTISGAATFPTLREFSKFISLFSGNLDGRKLNDLLIKYGIGTLNTPDKELLLTIKNKRNKIAHGEEMFKEACRHFTVAELVSLQTACFNALDSFVDQADSYIAQRLFTR
jgi:hypothetical protein